MKPSALLSSTKIKMHPFLAGLEAHHLAALEEAAMEVEFAPQEIIFRQGEPANRFYLLLEGSVVIEEQNSVPFQVVHGGEVLGWSAVFPPYTSHFRARALEKTKAIFLYSSWVLERCEQDHDLGYQLMRRMSAVLVERLEARRKARVTGSER
jgi:CRP/FNR family cyclic AMP-dependent transcriptional regulator